MTKNIVAFLMVLGAFVLLTQSCKKDFDGTYTDTNAPETFMSVDSIYRSGDSRYTTTVVANWWATAKGGFIKGYEVSTDNMLTWSFTAKQNGTFLLSIPAGSDTANIKIFVRAIDSKGVKDPTPAGLTFPVRNTAPITLFDFSAGQRINSFPAFRFSWNITDLDGAADVDRVELALNDTALHLVQLPSNVSGVTFVGEKSNGNFTGNYLLYNNAQTTPFTQKLSGALFNDTNKIYVRAVDKSGGKSAWAISKLYVRQPKSGILIITDYNTNSDRNLTANFYSTRLTNLGGSYASFDLVRSILDELPSDAFATSKTFEFFDRIVWATGDPTRSLGTAQTATLPFFNNGGKIFMILEIPNDVAVDAPFFSFTPIERLVVDPGRTFRMASGDLLQPYNSTWPTLKATGIITYPRPFFNYTASSGLYTYDSLASAQLRSFGTGNPVVWTGPSNVMGKRFNTQKGKTDFITLTVPLHLMNGNNNVDSFFKEVVVNQLQF